MSILFAGVSALSLLNMSLSASGSGWVTIQNGQFYLSGEPFFPIGTNGFEDDAELLEKIEKGVNVFRVWLAWLDLPETDEVIYNVWGSKMEPQGKDAKFDNIVRLAGKHQVFLLVNISCVTNYHFPFFDMKTPFDRGQTSFNVSRGGPCHGSEEILTHPEAIEMMKARVRKIVDRWGNGSTIFAWDLMNELNLMANPEEEQAAWVKEIGEYIRGYELEKYGRCHLRTVSSYKPEPEADFFYNSPGIDFVSSHMYHDSVLSPKDTISCALDAGTSVSSVIQRVRGHRPYLDTEHYPIMASPEYKDIIPKAYDNLVWAELAAGAAGPGFPFGSRWQFTSPMRSFVSLWLKKGGPVRTLEMSVSGANGFGSLRGEAAIFWFIKDEEQRSQQKLVEFRVSGLQDHEYELIWHSDTKPEKLGTTHVHGPSFSMKAIHFDESIAGVIRQLGTRGE